VALCAQRNAPAEESKGFLSQGVFHAWGQWSAVGLIRNAPGARSYAADKVNNPWMRDTADQSPKGHRTNGRSILFAWNYGEDNHGIKGLVCIGQTARDIPPPSLAVIALPSQIPVPSPPLELRQGFQRLPCRELVLMDLD
jgi:hypothetical protein